MPQTNTQLISEPFAAETLHKAGVACEDVIWFSRLPANLKMVAVRTAPRGAKILARLRVLIHRTN